MAQEPTFQLTVDGVPLADVSNVTMHRPDPEEGSATIFQTSAQWSDVVYMTPPVDPPRIPAQTLAPPGASYVDTLCLRRFSFEIVRIADRGDLLEIETRVESRGGEGPMPLTFSLRISRALRGRARARKIRTLLVWCMLHELDECLSYADGTPVVDPHPEQRDWRAHQGVHPAVARMSREAEKHERKAGGE